MEIRFRLGRAKRGKDVDLFSIYWLGAHDPCKQHNRSRKNNETNFLWKKKSIGSNNNNNNNLIMRPSQQRYLGIKSTWLMTFHLRSRFGKRGKEEVEKKREKTFDKQQTKKATASSDNRFAAERLPFSCLIGKRNSRRENEREKMFRFFFFILFWRGSRSPRAGFPTFFLLSLAAACAFFVFNSAHPPLPTTLTASGVEAPSGREREK